jgi:DNA topoisomerase-1
VHSVEKKQRRRNPAAPFITSTLQQEAGRKLGFTASRTMRTAQQLYEGVDTGDGAVGLITYMRTDSTTLAADAVAEIRAYIADTFGAANVPREQPVYRTRARNAQEAHEAIRPTSVRRTPESLAGILAGDQARLYELVWKRTVACQMRHATINTVAVEFTCGDRPWAEDSALRARASEESDPPDLLRATGATVAVPGFLTVYEEGLDDRKAEKERRLPPLERGMAVALKALRPEQHFTEPPPRYSEATLIRALEDYGIGRPSTYAAIISTLQQREYAELERRRFHPTDVGRLVNAFVTEHFGDYVDYEFTARLEDDLDAVSRGEREWVPLLDQFWKPFRRRVSDKEASVTRTEASQSRNLGTDPMSGRPVSVRVGRFGPYAQIGSAGDEEKPKFASLRRDQRVGTITLEEALAQFSLPRDLGFTPDGEPVLTNIGRFGPYVKFGSKFASLGADDDPYTIDLARALEIVAEKKRVDAQREIKEFAGGAIRILKGRYGPYLTDGKKNVRVPKGRDPSLIELEEAKRLIDAAPSRRPRRRRNS